jgi:hypothetical protein
VSDLLALAQSFRRSSSRSSRSRFSSWRVGVRAHRPRPGRRGPRRDGVGRDRRVPAARARLARQACAAGVGVRCSSASSTSGSRIPSASSSGA